MTLDWTRAAVLSVTEFEVCWGLLGLGETPWQLDPPRSGLTTAERYAIVVDAVVGLQRRGLGDGRGPGPAVAELLRLLAHPAWSLDVRFRADALVAGVTACRGPRCAFAVRHGSEIALPGLHTDAAASSLVDLLGPVAPGASGREVRLPADVLDGARTAAPGDHGRFTDELVRRGSARADAVALLDMCRAVDVRGQFGASVSARDGTRMLRAPYVAGFHRTTAGYYRQVRRRLPGGDLVTIGPTSRSRMLDDLGELVGSVAP
jgi:hypothetical protein